MLRSFRPKSPCLWKLQTEPLQVFRITAAARVWLETDGFGWWRLRLHSMRASGACYSTSCKTASPHAPNCFVREITLRFDRSSRKIASESSGISAKGRRVPSDRTSERYGQETRCTREGKVLESNANARASELMSTGATEVTGDGSGFHFFKNRLNQAARNSFFFKSKEEVGGTEDVSEAISTRKELTSRIGCFLHKNARLRIKLASIAGEVTKRRSFFRCYLMTQTRPHARHDSDFS